MLNNAHYLSETSGPQPPKQIKEPLRFFILFTFYIRHLHVKKVLQGDVKKFHKIHRRIPLCWCCNFNKKETPTEVRSYKFCEFFKNNFFIKHLRLLVLQIFEYYLL